MENSEDGGDGDEIDRHRPGATPCLFFNHPKTIHHSHVLYLTEYGVFYRFEPRREAHYWRRDQSYARSKESQRE
jgi:hypothetical protein